MKVPCGRCAGHGTIEAFAGVLGGVCFKCGGRGYVSQKGPYRSSRYYSVFVRMSHDDPTPRRWLGVRARSEKDAIRKARVTCARGAFAPFADTIQVREGNVECLE